MTISKVTRGQRFAIKAKEWNEIADHVNTGAHPASTGQSIQPRPIRVTICNTDPKIDMIPGMLVKIVDTLPEYGFQKEPSENFFDAALPSANEENFIPAIVVQEALRGNYASGQAIINGAAPVNISSPGNGIHAFPDGKGGLVINDAGPILVAPFSKNPNKRVAILGGGSTGTSVRGPFDTTLTSETANGTTTWTLTCIDTLGKKIAGYVKIGTVLRTVPTRSWTITGECILYLDITYTPKPSNPGNGTYSAILYAASSLPTLTNDEPRIVERIAEVKGSQADGFRLLKYRQPGDYTVTDRWVR